MEVKPEHQRHHIQAQFMVWKCCVLAVHLYTQMQHHIVNDWKAADASQRQSYSCTSLQIFQPVWSWTNHMRFALTFRLRLFTRAHTQHLNFVLWVFRDSVVSRIKSKHLNHQGSDRIGWCWKTFFFLQNLALCQGLFLLERWTPCMKPCSSRNEFDTGTPSHLVADHNQCLARTTFGHWSLEHHAGPAVPLSKHCTWRGLRSAESDWEICDFKIVYYR